MCRFHRFNLSDPVIWPVGIISEIVSGLAAHFLKMISKEKVKHALNHLPGGAVPVDFGSTPVTGIHVWTVARLREYYGLEVGPVRVIEPYQMLGQITPDLMEVLGVDVVGISPPRNIFGIENKGPWREFKTFWDQEVLVPADFTTRTDENGDLLIFPGGDMSAPPCAKMPRTSYFFDALIRQSPIEEDKLNPRDNLEEFNPVTDADLAYWAASVDSAGAEGRAVIANFGGTAFGDIALVPAMNLKYPRGIRDIAEWYMSVLMRPDYIHAIFDAQCGIAISNLKRLFDVVGNRVDVAFLCGTDFGTQDSQFCDPGTLRDLYGPYYRRINDWIHTNTTWKTFKHSCGAIEPLIDTFIDLGFDIINPVQINARGMDPHHLKEKYGDRIVFWGGGVDTQKVLAFGTPADVRRQVLDQCRIFSADGGFVFNTVHNIQANVPVENIAAMVEAIAEFNRG